MAKRISDEEVKRTRSLIEKAGIEEIRKILDLIARRLNTCAEELFDRTEKLLQNADEEQCEYFIQRFQRRLREIHAQKESRLPWKLEGMRWVKEITDIANPSKQSNYAFSGDFCQEELGAHIAGTLLVARDLNDEVTYLYRVTEKPDDHLEEIANSKTKLDRDQKANILVKYPELEPAARNPLLPVFLKIKELQKG